MEPFFRSNNFIIAFCDDQKIDQKYFTWRWIKTWSIWCLIVTLKVKTLKAQKLLFSLFLRSSKTDFKNKAILKSSITNHDPSVKWKIYISTQSWFIFIAPSKQFFLQILSFKLLLIHFASTHFPWASSRRRNSSWSPSTTNTLSSNSGKNKNLTYNRHSRAKKHPAYRNK